MIGPDVPVVDTSTVFEGAVSHTARSGPITIAIPQIAQASQALAPVSAFEGASTSEFHAMPGAIDLFSGVTSSTEMEGRFDNNIFEGVGSEVMLEGSANMPKAEDMIAEDAGQIMFPANNIAKPALSVSIPTGAEKPIDEKKEE